MANTTGQVMPDGSVQYYEDAMGRAMVSTDYDPTSSYAVGDYCIYDNVRYCCNTAIASGGETWNSAHWDVAKVDDDVSEIKSSLSDYLPKNVSGVGNLRILGVTDVYPTFTNGNANLTTTDYVPLADLDKIIAIIPFAVGARMIAGLTGNRGQIAISAYGSTYSGSAIACNFIFILAD